jgi:hypothetical protein
MNTLTALNQISSAFRLLSPNTQIDNIKIGSYRTQYIINLCVYYYCLYSILKKYNCHLQLDFKVTLSCVFNSLDNMTILDTKASQKKSNVITELINCGFKIQSASYDDFIHFKDNEDIILKYKQVTQLKLINDLINDFINSIVKINIAQLIQNINNTKYEYTLNSICKDMISSNGDNNHKLIYNILNPYLLIDQHINLVLLIYDNIDKYKSNLLWFNNNVYVYNCDCEFKQNLNKQSIIKIFMILLYFVSMYDLIIVPSHMPQDFVNQLFFNKFDKDWYNKCQKDILAKHIPFYTFMSSLISKNNNINQCLTKPILLNQFNNNISDIMEFALNKKFDNMISYVDILIPIIENIIDNDYEECINSMFSKLVCIYKLNCI